MGLFQNLLETYEKCSAAVGIVQTDLTSLGNANRRKLCYQCVIQHLNLKFV